MPYSVLMPVFAHEILHGGARELGWLMGATGVGALLGALSLAARVGVEGLGKLIALCAGGFGVSLILFAFSRDFWLSMILLLPVGFTMMVQMASSNTLLQSMVPDQMRGRVIAVYSMMFMGMAPFGAFFAGAIAHRIGAPWTVAIGGVACIAGSNRIRPGTCRTFRAASTGVGPGAGSDRWIPGGGDDQPGIVVSETSAAPYPERLFGKPQRGWLSAAPAAPLVRELPDASAGRGPERLR